MGDNADLEDRVQRLERLLAEERAEFVRLLAEERAERAKTEARYRQLQLRTRVGRWADRVDREREETARDRGTRGVDMWGDPLSDDTDTSVQEHVCGEVALPASVSAVGGNSNPEDKDEPMEEVQLVHTEGRVVWNIDDVVGLTSHEIAKWKTVWGGDRPVDTRLHSIMDLRSTDICVVVRLCLALLEHDATKRAVGVEPMVAAPSVAHRVTRSSDPEELSYTRVLTIMQGDTQLGKTEEMCLLAWIAYFLDGCIPVLLIKVAGGTAQGPAITETFSNSFNRLIDTLLVENHAAWGIAKDSEEWRSRFYVSAARCPNHPAIGCTVAFFLANWQQIEKAYRYITAMSQKIGMKVDAAGLPRFRIALLVDEIHQTIKTPGGQTSPCEKPLYSVHDKFKRGWGALLARFKYPAHPFPGLSKAVAYMVGFTATPLSLFTLDGNIPRILAMPERDTHINYNVLGRDKRENYTINRAVTPDRRNVTNKMPKSAAYDIPLDFLGGRSANDLLQQYGFAPNRITKKAKSTVPYLDSLATVLENVLKKRPNDTVGPDHDAIDMALRDLLASGNPELMLVLSDKAKTHIGQVAVAEFVLDKVSPDDSVVIVQWRYDALEIWSPVDIKSFVVDACEDALDETIQSAANHVSTRHFNNTHVTTIAYKHLLLIGVAIDAVYKLADATGILFRMVAISGEIAMAGATFKATHGKTPNKHRGHVTRMVALFSWFASVGRGMHMEATIQALGRLCTVIPDPRSIVEPPVLYAPIALHVFHELGLRVVALLPEACALFPDATSFSELVDAAIEADSVRFAALGALCREIHPTRTGRRHKPGIVSVTRAAVQKPFTRQYMDVRDKWGTDLPGEEMIVNIKEDEPGVTPSDIMSIDLSQAVPLPQPSPPNKAQCAAFATVIVRLAVDAENAWRFDASDFFTRPRNTRGELTLAVKLIEECLCALRHVVVGFGHVLFEDSGSDNPTLAQWLDQDRELDDGPLWTASRADMGRRLAVCQGGDFAMDVATGDALDALLRKVGVGAVDGVFGVPMVLRRAIVDRYAKEVRAKAPVARAPVEAGDSMRPDPERRRAYCEAFIADLKDVSELSREEWETYQVRVGRNDETFRMLANAFVYGVWDVRERALNEITNPHNMYKWSKSANGHSWRSELSEGPHIVKRGGVWCLCKDFVPFI
ncbi:hypothetical protein GHT06_003864 [Daphnia sinensis]|uniref:Uncharacterized protein n=1 Tax=Daphnia sinensis TaxID=1820382 RepID=A0AAD5L2F1_9CRUS|nr:hypothetical protein GHT06_003864 [Daphnia sinensis]